MSDDTPAPTRMKETLVCVGGPYDGRRVQIYRSQEFLHLAMVAKPTFTEPVEISAVEYVDFIYRRESYQAGGKVRMFLAPDKATPGETLSRLIDGYRQPIPERHRTGR